MEHTTEQLKAIIEQARAAAKTAAEQYLAKHGVRDCCGFAWVEIHGVKGNTRLGRLFKSIGVQQNYTRAFQLWNPAGVGVQSMNVLEAGAVAARDVLRQHGFTAYSCSRMD